MSLIPGRPTCQEASLRKGLRLLGHEKNSGNLKNDFHVDHAQVDRFYSRNLRP
jgi:hypothetical protein